MSVLSVAFPLESLRYVEFPTLQFPVPGPLLWSEPRFLGSRRTGNDQCGEGVDVLLHSSEVQRSNYISRLLLPTFRRSSYGPCVIRDLLSFETVVNVLSTPTSNSNFERLHSFGTTTLHIWLDTVKVRDSPTRSYSPREALMSL